MIKKSLAIELLYFFFLAVLTAVAGAYYHGNNEGRSFLFVQIISYFALYLVLFKTGESLLQIISAHPHWGRWSSLFAYSKKNIVCISAFLFSIYFFYLFIRFPGVCGADTVNQITDLVTGSAPLTESGMKGRVEISALLNDHHPVLTTLVFTLFYKFGQLIGNPNWGMFFYNLIQIVILAILFAVIICSMDRYHIPRPVALFSLFFYASPLIASFAISMLKDSLFSLFFVLYYITFINCVISANDLELGHRGNWTKLILYSVLIALLNKKGMYLVLFSNSCLLILQRGKERLHALVSVLLPVFVIVIFLGKILFPLLNIYPGGKQEALGFAFQQTALAMIEKPESFTKEETDVFFSILELSREELPDVYDPSSVDAIKSYFNGAAADKLLLTYLKQWAAHFFKTPISYIKATFSVNGGFIAPVKTHNLYFQVHWRAFIQAFSQPKRLTFARDLANQAITWFMNIPLVSALSQDSLYMFAFPSFSFYVFCKRKQWRNLIFLAPMLANLLFLLMGPICWTRYGLCQLYTFPLLLALTAQTIHTEALFEKENGNHEVLQNR